MYQPENVPEVEPESDREHAVTPDAEQEAEPEGEAAPDASQPPVVVGTYNSGDNKYVMFSDGSIEAQTPSGVFRFGSLDELKEFIADHQGSRVRFQFEAEITGGLEHPGIVPVYGLSRYADGRPQSDADRDPRCYLDPDHQADP